MPPIVILIQSEHLLFITETTTREGVDVGVSTDFEKGEQREALEMSIHGEGT